MNIKKLAASVAIAGTVSLLGAGVASADQAETGANLPAGGRVCVDLPTTTDPIRASGVAENAVRFTLVGNGAVLDSTTTVDWRAYADSYANPGAFPGTFSACAENLGDADSFVFLSLVSDEVDTREPSVGPVTTPVVVADQPGGGVSLPDPTPVVDADPGSIASVGEILQAVDSAVDAAVDSALGQVRHVLEDVLGS